MHGLLQYVRSCVEIAAIKCADCLLTVSLTLTAGQCWHSAPASLAMPERDVAAAFNSESCYNANHCEVSVLGQCDY